jgi:small subunit ribosomal protein S1
VAATFVGQENLADQSLASGTPETGAAPTPAEQLLWQTISDSLPPMPTGLPAGIVGEPGPTVPPRERMGKLSADLESELEAALAGFSMEEVLHQADRLPRERLPEDALVEARVVGVHGDRVFVDLGVREQGFLSLKDSESAPEVGATIKVRIVRFDPENSIYEVALPARASDVAAWEDLSVGMLVEARVTGVNSGGLECEVNHIRGFIPISQIDVYRVSNPEEYIGQRLTCVVLEANRERRNLVLSRRAAIEREQQAAREAFWAQLEPGQVYEGLVRKITDFGAFVDLGGADGLLHISQMSWGRINHPSEVLQEGQRIKVKVLSVDKTARRISLAYRDLLGDPWEQAASKYPETAVVRGKVTRIMPYGAFVELEPGIEGLVHISELAWKKVWRVGDVVKEGQEVEAVVLSVDPQARRISLSMKHLTPRPEEIASETGDKPVEDGAAEASAATAASTETPSTEAVRQDSPVSEPSATQPKKKPKQERPLQGGLGKSPQSNKFGLRW